MILAGASISVVRADILAEKQQVRGKYMCVLMSVYCVSILVFKLCHEFVTELVAPLQLNFMHPAIHFVLHICIGLRPLLFAGLKSVASKEG